MWANQVVIGFNVTKNSNVSFNLFIFSTLFCVHKVEKGAQAKTH